MSFEVESLFTNVPNLETIDSLSPSRTMNLRPTDGLLREFGFLLNDLKKMLIICTQESHFQFDGKF